jgi:type VI secretion system secreted protein Hcp
MAFDTYLYFEGGPKVEGETSDKTYSAKKAIQVLSFSWGASNPVSIGSGTGGGGAGKVSFSDLSVMCAMDTSTAQLMQMMSAGGHVTTVTLVCRKSGSDAKVASAPYYTVTMTEVFCTSVQMSGSGGGDDLPTVSLSLAFATVATVYQKQDKAGVLSPGSESGWDITANAAL